MRTHRAMLVAFALLAMACAGRSEDSDERPDAPGERCADGLLVVDGPVTSILARYPAASPPDRLLRHSTSPGMFITVEAGGWARFDLYEAVAAGAVATIETRDVSTGEPLCPLEVVIDR